MGSIGLMTPRMFTLRSIDPISAHSLVAVWHQLHTFNDIEHDYPDMLGPVRNNNSIFFAVTHTDNIRAIARCETGEPPCLVGIAYAPYELESGTALVQLLYTEKGICGDVTRLAPRWRCEVLYVNS